MEQSPPIIVHENEDKSLKVSYFGENEVFLTGSKGSIAIHLGDIEWVINTLENM